MLDLFVEAGKWLWAVRTYQPPWMPLYLKVVIGVSLAAVVIPLVYWKINGKEYHDAWVIRENGRARIADLKKERYKFVATLNRSTAARSEAGDRVLPDIWAKEEEIAEDGARLQEAALYYADAATTTKFYYTILAGHSVWKTGSADHVEGGDNGIGIEQAVKHDFVEKLVNEANRLVCIGVASSEPGPNNTGLADDRAVNLCRALFNVGYAREGAHRAFGISVGEAKFHQGVSTNLQRSVIIVGIGNTNRIPQPLDVVESVTELARIPGVRLDQYARSDDNKLCTFRDVLSGPLTGAEGFANTCPQAAKSPLE